MHIAILYQYYLGKGDPGHSRVNEYVRIWAEQGHKISVLTGQTSYMTGQKADRYTGRLCVSEKDGAVDVYRCYVPDRVNASFVRRAWGYFAFALSSALAYRKLTKPDVLLVSSPPLTIGWAALLIKRFSRVPMVFEVRDLWPESAITTGVLKNKLMIGLLYQLEEACYRKARKVVTLTPAFKKSILARGLASEEDIVSVPCGVDVDEMNPSKASVSLRDDLDWAGKFTVLYTGAVGRANRIGQLIDAAELLRERKDILIAVVGDGMELAGLRARAKREGLSNIAFHGLRPKQAMPAITASADACIAVLMKNDTFKTVYPNKIFDYMACGKPVILAIDGVMRKVVERADAGVYVEPENALAIADAIRMLADDPTKASALGRKGRCCVEAQFSRKDMSQQYVDLLEEVSSAV